jgi:multidrug resistance efflux pump
MLEFLLCSILTIFPDYLFRRYGQGKRIGREITLFSMWYELRWGITACVLLTLTLITLIFYFHPSTSNAASFYRTIPVLPEGSGRVAEVYVGLREEVDEGTPLFRLDSTEQEAAVETARRRVAEVNAKVNVAEAQRQEAEARLIEARSSYQQALDELDTRVALRERNPDTVALREVERAQNVVDGRQGAVDAALAAQAAADAQINFSIPAELASAEGALAQAETELAKTTVYAGVDGRLEQFTLRVGDIVNPLVRPAGILIPSEAGRLSIQAGFGQIEAQVLRPGMIGEAVCISLPFRIVPLVVTEVQGVIAAGQLRPSDQLVEPAVAPGPGSIVAYLEPLFEGSLASLPPGSRCIVNAYTSNHDVLEDPEVGTLRRFALHGIDAVGLVHAAILRLQAILLPVRTLVLSGGH